MKIKIGQTEIEVSVDQQKGTFKVNIITTLGNNWIDICISKGLISKSNMHIEINLDKEMEG